MIKKNIGQKSSTVKLKNLYGLVDFETTLATNATPIRFLLSISYSLRPFCAKVTRKIRFISEIF